MRNTEHVISFQNRKSRAEHYWDILLFWLKK